MQGYIDLVGFFFIAGVILATVIPERKEKPRKSIRLLEASETK